MERPAPPSYEDFGLTEERYHAVKRSMLAVWANQSDCPTCRKVRHGFEYVIRTITDADYRARQHYDEALKAYEDKLDAYYRWLDEKEGRSKK